MRELMQRIDDEIGRVYEEMPDAGGIRPAWVLELLRLAAHGPMTIRQLADSAGRTHAALSQKVAAMEQAGLVEKTRVARDGRTREVRLTDRARGLVEQMRAEWMATEEVLAELEAEIPYPLSTVVRDLEAALERKSFYDRLRERLAETAPPNGQP